MVGYPRLVEPPAVKPAKGATNNINVVSMSYLPNGMNIHFQTPFGLTGAPTVLYGAKKGQQNIQVTGNTKRYVVDAPKLVLLGSGFVSNLALLDSATLVLHHARSCLSRSAVNSTTMWP
jgi:hypothetical protein